MNQQPKKQSPNMLFWSRNCKTSIPLIQMLKSENLLGFFKLISVGNTNEDNITLAKAASMGLKIVPTMIVSDVEEPLVGAGTFEWIKRVKFLQQAHQTTTNKKIIQQNISRFSNNDDTMLEFNPEEMLGISDKYAYTKTDDAQSKSYVSINKDGEDKNVIFTAPEYSKINGNDQKRMVEDVQKARDDQVTNFSDVMKKQQIHAVIKNENSQIN
jgi:hypothetical protein